jgi:hypothetical protein
MMRILKWFISLFRQVPTPTPIRRPPPRSARKRKASKRYVRANIDAPIMQQARDIARR